ncbi:MAG: glycosyltransferase family 2 protein, partial [Anaerolineae bacterium]|nr:glycosyltransferase family 2 protein [Anaerolineae bacterium]
MTHSLTSIIIPTQRGRQWLPACFAALAAQTYRDFEVVVIDNASTDGTSEWLATAEHGLQVRIIRNEHNIGFAAAINQGIRASAGPLVALLNDDTEPAPGWLAALVSAIGHDDERIGAVASLMTFAAQPDVVQSAGIAIDRAAIAWDRLAGRAITAPECQQPCDIFGASGGAALFQRVMLDQIGLFDERFFAYLEDADLAWRAQRAGWRCRYAPQARVLHHTSATSGEGSPFKRRLLGRNKIWMVAKNARLRDLPLILFYDALAVGFRLFAQRDTHALRGRIEAWRDLGPALQARQASRPSTPPQTPPPMPRPLLTSPPQPDRR